MTGPDDETEEQLDERLDEALDETFPASDPVAVHHPESPEPPHPDSTEKLKC